jgi:bla regulator protein blaR1
MIAAFIFYGLLLSAFVAAAAWLIEAALVACGRARRLAWLAGIVIAVGMPLGMALLQSAQPATSALTTVTMSQRTAAPRVFTIAPQAITQARFAGASLDNLAFGAWGIATFALLSYYGVSLWRLARHARRWPTHRFGTQSVTVAQEVGPAVFGWLRPRVVFPRWLLSAPPETQRMALLHEREHLVARDSQILTSAMLLFALFPWNAPLAWMLRRLRFAMEVDCDARVVRGGADAASYGEALLYVSQRQVSAPAPSIALIERPSQLERRINIMFASPRKYPVLIAGFSFALAGSCLFAATKIEAPANAPAPVLKPPPGGEQMMRLGYAFEQYIGQRYAGLFDKKVDGTSVVIMLVNDDMSIARSAQIIVDKPIEQIAVDESMFSAIGMAREQVPYAGAMGMQSPGDPEHKVLAVYTEKKVGDERFVSRLFTDTRTLDREIYQQRFPNLARNGVPTDTNPWILIDREGHVLRSGQESMAHDKIAPTLEARFAGIKTREVTVTPLVDGSNHPVLNSQGRDVHLTSVWLAPGSPPPGS